MEQNQKRNQDRDFSREQGVFKNEQTGTDYQLLRKMNNSDSPIPGSGGSGRGRGGGQQRPVVHHRSHIIACSIRNLKDKTTVEWWMFSAKDRDPRAGTDKWEARRVLLR